MTHVLAFVIIRHRKAVKIVKWFKNLYFGDAAAEMKNMIIRDIRKHKPQTGVYVLTLPENEKDILDIFSANVFLRLLEARADHDFVIVGIALGKKESYEVMEKIMLDCYTLTGGFNVRNLCTDTAEK